MRRRWGMQRWSVNKHDRGSKGGNIKTGVSILRLRKNGRMANFNAHKRYFRTAVWGAAPDGTAVAVSSPGGILEGGGLSGSHRESEGTADAARDIARSPFGHEPFGHEPLVEPTPILHEPRTQASLVIHSALSFAQSDGASQPKLFCCSTDLALLSIQNC